MKELHLGSTLTAGGTRLIFTFLEVTNIYVFFPQYNSLILFFLPLKQNHLY